MIEIDPADLPLDAEVRRVQQELVPYARSGTLVHFDVRRTHQGLVVLRRADGEPVPVGTRVQLIPGGTEFQAGRRGEVWLTDLADERQRLRVSWPGGACEVDLQLPPSTGDEPLTLGPLVCDGPGK